MTRPGLFSAAAGVTLLAMVPASPRLSPTGAISLSLDKAAARVGRPFTPMSVAGVHRRAYRRGYGGWGPAAGVGLGLGALAAGAAAASSYGYNSYPYAGSYGPTYYGSNTYYSSPSYYGSNAYYGGGSYYAPAYPAYRWRHWGW
jgi:hypothetical protein